MRTLTTISIALLALSLLGSGLVAATGAGVAADGSHVADGQHAETPESEHDGHGHGHEHVADHEDASDHDTEHRMEHGHDRMMAGGGCH